MKQLELNFDKELSVSRAELLALIEDYCDATADYVNDVGCVGEDYAKEAFEISKSKVEAALDKLYDTPRNNV